MKFSSFSKASTAAFCFCCGCLVSTFLAFRVWVESPAVAISLHKQNVFYIGVDNPISVVVSGVPSEQVTVEAQNLNLIKVKGSNYNVRATQPGEASITVTVGSIGKQSFSYRVKRIPDPTPTLGGKHKSKAIGNGEFKAQAGIAAVIENFDFDAKCDVQGFAVSRLRKRQDVAEKRNTGARFSSDVANFVSAAVPGDTYFFDEIKARCPGDVAARELGSLVFRIR